MNFCVRCEKPFLFSDDAVLVSGDNLETPQRMHLECGLRTVLGLESKKVD